MKDKLGFGGGGRGGGGGERDGWMDLWRLRLLVNEGKEVVCCRLRYFTSVVWSTD